MKWVAAAHNSLPNAPLAFFTPALSFKKGNRRGLPLNGNFDPSS
jgi:hypothetical protein